jgi:hypothetical protein
MLPLTNPSASSNPVSAPEPAPAILAVTIVHGTFPRGPWLQLRRNLRALWARMRGRQFDEAAMWPVPASQPNQRHWFESSSEFERDLARRSGLPPGSVLFNRFLWSGCNTFGDRAEAARSLRAALWESLREHPGVPHVVLAHSHGGTVAVKALDTRNESHDGETPDVRALLTLATPFVRLIRRGLPERLGNFQILLPVTLLLLAPLMALDFGLSSEGVANAVAAVVFGFAALVAAWRISLMGATMIIAIIVSLGGLTLFVHLLLWASLVFFMLADPFDVWRAPRQRYLEAAEHHLEDEPLCLPCPLIALRAPRDEASLVIGLGQVAQGLWHIGGRVLWHITGGRLLGGPELGFWTLRFWASQLVGLLFFVLVVPVLVWLEFGWVGRAREWAEWWLPKETPYIYLQPYLPIWAGTMATTLLMFCITSALILAWSLPAMAISLATGREAFMLPADTLVEAEPLPNARASDGLQPTEMALEILYGLPAKGLNHSLYDAPAVRDRIAIWLREQAGVPAAKREAEEDRASYVHSPTRRV